MLDVSLSIVISESNLVRFSPIAIKEYFGRCVQDLRPTNSRLEYLLLRQ